MAELLVVLAMIVGLAYAGHWITTSDHPAIEFLRVLARILAGLSLLALNVVGFTVRFVRAEVRQW